MTHSGKKARTKREERYPPNGAVPQSERTPAAQLAYLDAKGFVATKERAKLAARLVSTASKKK